MARALRSYTSGSSLLTKFREAIYLSRGQLSAADGHVQRRIRVMDGVADTLRRHYGLVLEDLDVLDIGTGQQQVQSAWLARRNRVTGIDLDIVAKGWSPLPYLEMWRRNGVPRVLKTIGRKALGIDAKFRRALREQLERTADDLPVLPMDMTRMSFPAESFDFVYCSSVLQSVPDVGAGLSEMNRVLRAGGIGYFTIQLYSSETGSLDPRLYTDERAAIPYWAHLRPECRHLVAGNAWLNRLRLDAWRALIGTHLSEATIELGQPQAERMRRLAAELQARGALADYSVEELITHELRVHWRKSALPSAPAT